MSSQQSLIRQLAAALADAVNQVEEHNNEYQHKTPPEKIELWRSLLDLAQKQEVQVLDSSLYDSVKCGIARCEPGGVHHCGQDDRYTTIARNAADKIETVASKEKVAEIVSSSIAEAMGTIRLPENVKVIRDRLVILRSYLNHREAMELAISRYTLEDLNWLHDVAVRALGLYAKEAYQSWCGTHRKQMTACSECLTVARSRTLKTLASAVKKVASPEIIQALRAAAYPDEEFMRFLREEGPAKDPVEGVGL